MSERVRSGILLGDCLCRSGVRAKFGVDMGIAGELAVSRSLKRGVPVKAGNRADKTLRMKQ